MMNNGEISPQFLLSSPYSLLAAYFTWLFVMFLLITKCDKTTAYHNHYKSDIFNRVSCGLVSLNRYYYILNFIQNHLD